MKIGDLVEIGWNGKENKPFVGVIVGVEPKSGVRTGYVMVNGKTQYVDLEKLRVVKDAAWRSGKKEESEVLWADRFKE